MLRYAAAAYVEDVLELQHEEEEGDEFRADDPRADLAERKVGREEQEAREDDDRVDGPVHAPDGRHVSEGSDARRPLQVAPYDLQQDEEAGAEEKDAVEMEPVLLRRPVVENDGEYTNNGCLAGHERYVRVSRDARAWFLRQLREQPREHVRSRVLEAPLLSDSVRIVGGDLCRDRQVVEGHEEHPVELQFDDEDEDPRHEVREHPGVPVVLALAHPLAHKVKFYGMHAREHGEQAHEKRNVQERECRDGYVFRYHVRWAGVVYIYSSESCAENVPNI